jgi:serine phosphatase RsbU (regulator of sigma subunit)
MASVAVSSYRNSRRRGEDLETSYHELDAVIESQFGDSRFTTAVLATLELSEGTFRWLNAGHPPLLLVRDGRVVRELTCRPTTPAGLGGKIREIAEERLQPGDSVVFYTDGVTEARSPSGEQFGDERLHRHIARWAAEGSTLPETLRRLILGILDHQRNQLQDDATVLFATWHGPPVVAPLGL